MIDKIKQALSCKYFYIGGILSSLVVCFISFTTLYILNSITPAINQFEEQPFNIKSSQLLKEIEYVCSLSPDQEFLLIGFIGSNMEIITKIKNYKNWNEGYRESLAEEIKMSIMRGISQLSLTPLPIEKKGELT
jgi:hypothetical protein